MKQQQLGISGDLATATSVSVHGVQVTSTDDGSDAGTPTLPASSSIENFTFSIGMIVELVTLHGKILRGEVVAYDRASQVVALKSASSGSVNKKSDVQVVNLQFVSDVHCISDQAISQSTAQPLPNLNFAKLTARMNSNIEDKQRKIGYRGLGVSPTGQGLVNTITKTLPEVRWDGQNIVVMEMVTIAPPYDITDCRLNEGHATQIQALQHVQKLVEKFHKEKKETATSSSSSSLQGTDNYHH